LRSPVHPSRSTESDSAPGGRRPGPARERPRVEGGRPGPGRRVAGILFLASLTLGACSKDRVRTAPAPTYSLSGRLRLAGPLTDADGVTLGERSVDDAGGIKV